MTFDSNPTLPGVADPYPVYRSVRESDPVHWCTGACLWAVTRYADADAVLKDERFSRQGFLDGVEARMGHHVILEMRRHELVFTDNPRHGQLRALISEAVTPQAVQALRRGGLCDHRRRKSRSGNVFETGAIRRHASSEPASLFQRRTALLPRRCVGSSRSANCPWRAGSKAGSRQAGLRRG